MRQKLAKPIRLPAKTVCIGNVMIGGTGKTQVAIWLAGQFLRDGVSCVVISKGYKGSLQGQGAKLVSKEDEAYVVGDEAKEISEFVKTISSRNITDTMALLEKLRPRVIIVDDFMQNPHFKKDYTILVIDQEREFGNGLIIPAGPLREKVESGIKRSNAAVVVGNEKHCSFKWSLRYVKNEANINYHSLPNKRQKADIGHQPLNTFYAQIKPKHKFDKSLKYYAFAGIGNPNRFFNSLRALELELVKTKIFSDHHVYKRSEIESMAKDAISLNARLITTKKDLVKLNFGFPILCFEVELNLEEEGVLMQDIYEKISKDSL